MTNTLCLRNRQRTRAVDLRLLRRITQYLLENAFHGQLYELGIHLLGAQEMARLNRQFLRHEGSTDVITFNYSQGDEAVSNPRTRAQPCLGANDRALTIPDAGIPEAKERSASPAISGEIFVCIDDALKQARQFRASWQSELVRYVIHGLLHLHGYDDLEADGRGQMKREENRLLKLTARQFQLAALGTRNPKAGTRS